MADTTQEDPSGSPESPPDKAGLVPTSRRRIRRGLLIAAVLLGACAVAFAIFQTSRLSDLRPPELIDAGITPEREQRGRELLSRLADAHGGQSTWNVRRAAQVELRDHWPGAMMRALAMPWTESGLLMRSVMSRGTDASRLEFLEGEGAGTAWGIQNWMTYRIPVGGQPTFEDDETIRFWLPTLQYFFEAPFRLREGSVVADAGSETVTGVTYQRVFISWGHAEPRPATDQYLAWIHPDSGRLEYLEYTVRDMMPSIVGCMHYRDYRQIDDLWIAMTMAVVEGPGGPDALHRLELEDVRFEEVSADVIMPRPDLSRPKYLD